MISTLFLGGVALMVLIFGAVYGELVLILIAVAIWIMTLTTLVDNNYFAGSLVFTEDDYKGYDWSSHNFKERY